MTRTDSEFGQQLVRELTLERRRSRVPWVYTVYHRRNGGDRGGRAADEVGLPRVGEETEVAGADFKVSGDDSPWPT